MTPTFPPVDALLIDIDGTLHEDGAPIPGAIETIENLRANGIPFRFLTNITRYSAGDLADYLQPMGFEAEPHEIVTATIGAARWLERNDVRRVRLLVTPSSRAEFSSFETDATDPEVVLVGDLGSDWSYDILNVALHDLLGGAKLVAIQRNRYWRTGEGIVLDAGAFVAALEYAASCEAIVVGKPSRAFFESAIGELDLDPDRIAMIGDDVENDVEGGRAAGLLTIGLRTGKYRPEDEERFRASADAVIDSIAHLGKLIGR